MSNTKKKRQAPPLLGANTKATRRAAAQLKVRHAGRVTVAVGR